MRVWLCFVVALVLTFDAAAQVRVVKSGSAKIHLDWTGFATQGGGPAATFAQTLRRDLVRSGYFSQAGMGQGEVVLKGAVSVQGADLRAECTVLGAVTQKVYLNSGFNASARDPVRFAHKVSDAIVEAVTGKKGMASARLVMVGTQTGKKELYLVGSDGGSRVQLTRDGSVSVAPNWGEGNRITYTSFLKGYPDVYMIDVDTGKRDRISSYTGLNTSADISPDGQDIAMILSKDGNPELYVKNLRSEKLTRITTTSKAAEASPSWSPDGQSIVYVSDSAGRPHLYTVSRNGGRPKRLTSRGSENVAPDWGNNGKIAYCTRSEGRYQVAVLDPVTGANTILATRDGGDYEDPSWAPDGRHLACSRTVNYRSKVYILDTLGDASIALTDYDGDWYSPSWSP